MVDSFRHVSSSSTYANCAGRRRNDLCSSGVVDWRRSSLAIGALLLASVVPMTLVTIKPVNDVLLDESHAPDSEDTEGLSRQWGPKHLWRSIVSGASFILFLVGNGSGV